MMPFSGDTQIFKTIRARRKWPAPLEVSGICWPPSSQDDTTRSTTLIMATSAMQETDKARAISVERKDFVNLNWHMAGVTSASAQK